MKKDVRVRFMSDFGVRLSTRVGPIAATIGRYFQDYPPHSDGYGIRTLSAEISDLGTDEVYGILNRQQLMVYAEANEQEVIEVAVENPRAVPVGFANDDELF